MIIERLKAANIPVILVINKIDKVHPDQLWNKLMISVAKMDFKEIVPISALQGNNVETLLNILKDNLEEGFQYFPEDQITDHPERFLVSEMIREKILKLTEQEVPHSVAVIVDSMKRDQRQTRFTFVQQLWLNVTVKKVLSSVKKALCLRKLVQWLAVILKSCLVTRFTLKLGLKLRKTGVIKNLISLTLVTTRKNINRSFN